MNEPRARVTRRGLQVALGLIWLLDGGLQLQPFMLRTSFARNVIAPVAAGQPHFVAGPVHWAANLIAAHPVAWDVPFASVQILIGLGLLFPRTAKAALAVSLPWALGVWFFGEGLSGLASGHTSLLTGAPGAVLLYGVLALAAWPRNDLADEAPARWLPLAWAVVWVGGAIFQALPGQNTGPAVAGTILGGPGRLGRLDASVARWATDHGTLIVVALVVVEVLIGLGAGAPPEKAQRRRRGGLRARARDLGRRAGHRPALHRTGNRSEQRTDHRGIRDSDARSRSCGRACRRSVAGDSGAAEIPANGYSRIGACWGQEMGRGREDAGGPACDAHHARRSLASFVTLAARDSRFRCSTT